MMEPSNLILTADPSHVWTQDDGQGRIGLRFDSGDSGLVYLDQERTQEAIDALVLQQKQMGWAGADIFSAMEKLSVEDRARLLALTLIFAIKRGEIEASTIRGMLDRI